MSGLLKCPNCQNYVTLRYPLSIKLNPLSPIVLFMKTLKGKIGDQIVFCPKCGYKDKYDNFLKFNKL